MSDDRTRGRAWAEELAELAAREHDARVPVDADARVVLTPTERDRGLRATAATQVERQLQPLRDAFERFAEAAVRALSETARRIDAAFDGVLEREATAAIVLELGRRAAWSFTFEVNIRDEENFRLLWDDDTFVT